MPVKTSTGLAAHLAVTGSLKAAFDGGLIRVYDGTPPDSADDAVVGNLLWTISVNGDGTGLTFDSTPVGRALVKPDAAVWGGATAAGTPTYYRLVAAGDTGASSTTQKRVQGTVGSVAGVDLYMTNPVLATNSNLLAKVLIGYSLTLPAQ
jgi:hypothetical protein